jgi:DivIVA domain-containing protein
MKMNQLKLDSKMILEKEFDVDIKGYNAKQVDMFLDIVCQDYQLFESSIRELNDIINELNNANIRLAQKLDATIKDQVVSNEIAQTEPVNMIDILQRLSKLEQEVYNQKR